MPVPGDQGASDELLQIHAPVHGLVNTQRCPFLDNHVQATSAPVSLSQHSCSLTCAFQVRGLLSLSQLPLLAQSTLPVVHVSQLYANPASDPVSPHS